MNKVQEENVRDAYKNLILAGSKYMKDNTSTNFLPKALHSTVAFNLGNAVNPENPVLNPEVIADSLI
jgi:hypothetical protein